MGPDSVETALAALMRSIADEPVPEPMARLAARLEAALKKRAGD